MTSIFRSCRVPAAAALLLITGTARADIVVVAGAKSPLTAATAEQVAAVMLGKAQNLPGSSGPVTAFDLQPGAVRDELYLKLANKSAAQMSALRANLVFSGKGQPPKVAASNEELIKWLGENANGVGYLDKAGVNAQVKVLLAP